MRTQVSTKTEEIYHLLTTVIMYPSCQRCYAEEREQRHICFLLGQLLLPSSLLVGTKINEERTQFVILVTYDYRWTFICCTFYLDVDTETAWLFSRSHFFFLSLFFVWPALDFYCRSQGGNLNNVCHLFCNALFSFYWFSSSRPLNSFTHSNKPGQK